MGAASYAVLGLLALGPASPYRLVQECKRSLRHFWPRAERKLYDEPKRLERLGLITGREERSGKRVRTVYEINEAGRAALSDWFRRPSHETQFESEAVLKVSLGDLATKNEMIAALRQLRSETDARMAEGREIARAVLEAGPADTYRLHVIAVMYEFVFSHFETMARWAEWAEREVESWPDTHRSDDLDRTLDVFRRALERSEPFVSS